MKEKENRFNFTKKGLETLSLPSAGKRAYYYDTKVRGLGVAVTSKGTISFIVYRKIHNKPERVILGHYPDVSIETARGLASEVNSKIAQGKNPNQDRNKLHDELTLKELFAFYLERHAKVHKKSWKDDVDQYRLYLSPWDKRKLSSLQKTDIEALHARVGKECGPYAANRMLALLGVMFSKAATWGWSGGNPVIGIQKFKEKSRDRFLQGDELPKFFEALANEPNRTLADFFMLSLLTGARRSNMLSMRWEDINFQQAIWRIEETKNGNSQTIALSSEAIKLLNMHSEARESEWVFPSSTSQSGHLEEPKSAWKRILKQAGLKDLRLHDLRRTLGSWQAATGANSYVIGKSLGHKTQQATAIYARLNLDPVRESVERATSLMLAGGVKSRSAPQEDGK